MPGAPCRLRLRFSPTWELPQFLPAPWAGVPRKARTTRLRADELQSDLSYLAVELNAGIPARIKLFKEIIGQLRDALESRYPGRQFLKHYPIDDAKASAV